LIVDGLDSDSHESKPIIQSLINYLKQGELQQSIVTNDDQSSSSVTVDIKRVGKKD